MLSNIRQDHFPTIQEYKETTKDICARLRFCMKQTEEKECSKAEESFYHGLSQRTQLEMSRLNITTIAGISGIIKCTDDTLFKQIAQERHTRATDEQNPRNEKYNTKIEKTCKLHYTCKQTTDNVGYFIKNLEKYWQSQGSVLKLGVANISSQTQNSSNPSRNRWRALYGVT